MYVNTSFHSFSYPPPAYPSPSFAHLPLVFLLSLHISSLSRKGDKERETVCFLLFLVILLPSTSIILFIDGCYSFSTSMFSVITSMPFIMQFCVCYLCIYSFSLFRDFTSVFYRFTLYLRISIYSLYSLYFHLYFLPNLASIHLVLSLPPLPTNTH